MIAALLLATSTAAQAGYRDTWHGGTLGADICYNQKGAAFEGERWKFGGVAVPCFAFY